jgi:hypothetical protein
VNDERQGHHGEFCFFPLPQLLESLPHQQLPDTLLHPFNSSTQSQEIRSAMKNRNLIISLALLGSLTVAGAAQAEGKIYVGAKVDVVQSDIAGYDDAMSVGVYGGYNLLGKDSHFAADLKGGTLAVEGEAIMTIVKGDAPGLVGDWDITSLGIFAAYRHPLTDNFYLKGRVGLVSYDITGNESALAAGIGAGWKVGPGRLEAEVTTYEGDVLLIGAGFHMNF